MAIAFVRYYVLYCRHTGDYEMILNKEQAKAVYDAMCALNNVSHTYMRTNFCAPNGKRISVVEVDEGISITLLQGNRAEQIEAEEVYDNQSAFAAAYGLTEFTGHDEGGMACYKLPFSL